MTHDLTPEDTAAMRAVPGDWREYLRTEMDRGRQRAGRAARAPQKPAPHLGRKPGGWPPATRPPDPPPAVPDAEIQRALAEYRQWLDDGQPPGHYRCECTACRQLPGGTR